MGKDHLKTLTLKDYNKPRADPYPKTRPTKRDEWSTADKENVDATPKSKPKLSKAAATAHDQYGDFRDIPLDTIMGEVPCYDNAATVRRKLKKLLTDKTTIPGTSKKWTQVSMAQEMEELERRDGAVQCHRNSNGPSPSSLATFLKKTGQMGGGNTACYYWGYVLCEKLRIWDGGKKTKTREEAERT